MRGLGNNDGPRIAVLNGRCDRGEPGVLEQLLNLPHVDLCTARFGRFHARQQILRKPRRFVLGKVRHLKNMGAVAARSVHELEREPHRIRRVLGAVNSKEEFDRGLLACNRNLLVDNGLEILTRVLELTRAC
eukprot:Amastigsp_a4191_29.p3 type:complete len:132 gc:universal Amastigsp_a4191_29:470-75(-)